MTVFDTEIKVIVITYWADIVGFEMFHHDNVDKKNNVLLQCVLYLQLRLRQDWPCAFQPFTVFVEYLLMSCLIMITLYSTTEI